MTPFSLPAFIAPGLLALVLAPVAATALQATSEPAVPAAPRVLEPSASRTNAALDKALAALCEKYPARASSRIIGKSAGGVPIQVLVLSGRGDKADTQPGILVVAGLDGARWSTTETSLALAEDLLASNTSLLDAVTVFVVPRANPDAANAFFSVPCRDYSGNALQHDNDRDRRSSENPPQDMNGDGFITVIRARDLVAPYANPTMVADADDPRVLRAPDPLKGEVAVYTVFAEGIDTDGDGRISEDGLGGIVPDRNFPHRWPEFEDEAGGFPLAAPEANALVRFVLAHPSLVGSLVLGRIDTAVNAPDGKARTEAGTPVMIGEDDAKAYAALAESYRTIVGQKNASEADSAGSFVAWMNAQRGVPTIGAQLWGKPEQPKEDKPASDEAPADGKAKPSDDKSKPADTKSKPSDKKKSSASDEVAWLAFSDAQGGAGFVKWAPLMHPQLGSVEVGGWVPGWRENVPLAQIADMGGKCAAFVAAMADHRANIVLTTPRVTQLGPGLYRIETSLANTGRLPTIQQGGRTGDVTPAHVVRVSTPVDRVKSGQRMSVVRGLKPGDVRPTQWIVAAAPEEVVEVELLFVGQPVAAYSIRNGEVIK